MKKKECSFLKKRTKKLLLPGAAHHDEPAQDVKVFCFFSSEKKTLLALLQ